MFERILVAVDGSEPSMRAVRIAADIARAMRSEHLRVVAAFEPVPSYLGQPNLDLAIRARLEEAEEALRLGLAVVGDVPAEIHEEMIEGSPADAILKVAKTWNSSLIVMGARGRSALAELVLGSTSQKVISHGPCPVLIIQ